MIFISSLYSYAQFTNAKATWSSSFPNKPGYLMYATSDASIVVGTNTTDAAVMDGKSGKVLWRNDFNTMLGSKKCDLQYVMDEAGVLFLYSTKDVLHVLDINTGQELWKSDSFKNINLNSVIYLPELKSFVIVTKDALHLIEAQTGKKLWRTEKFRGAVAHNYFDKSRNELILLNYKTSWGALASGYKNQIMSIDVRTGNVNWEQEYFGVIHINKKTNKPVFDMMVKDDHVYLMIQGLQVLDRNSGLELWKADYDLFDTKVLLGMPDHAYFYKGIAYPLIEKDAVYLVYNKPAGGKVLIQKLDKRSGNLLWEHKVDGRNNPVPTLKLVDGKLIAQLGGRINVVSPVKVGTSYLYESKYKWDGKFGIIALDEKTGQVAWEFKKLDDRITNVEVIDDKVFFADSKLLRSVHVASGNMVSSVPVKTLKCGNPFEILVRDNKVICVGDNGLAGVNSVDMKPLFNVVHSKAGDHSNATGNTYLLKNDKMISFVDLLSGKVLGMYKYEKGGKYSVGNNGATVTTISAKAVQRFDFASNLLP